MATKRFFLPILLCITLLLAGCETFSPFGAAGKKEQKGRAAISLIEDKQEKNSGKKMEEISTLAYGIQYDLGKMTNPPTEVEVALKFNTRILTLSGNPNLERMKEMQALVDQLTSDLAKEKEKGKKALEDKDQEIDAIQKESQQLLDAKDAAIKNYMDAAAKSAAQADGYKAQIDDLNSYWGLGAIWYGIKRFVVRFMWTFVTLSVLFLILRLAAQSNPIAASVFSVFEMAVSWVIQGLKTLFPKAISFAGHIPNSTLDKYKNCLTKIIDSIQLVKAQATKTGKEPTLSEALDEVSKSLDVSEKQTVDEIKTQLNWH